MTKQEIKEYIQNNCLNKETGKLIAARMRKDYLIRHGFDYHALETLYSDSQSIDETVYRLLNDIDIRPVCKMCGKPVWYSNGTKFATYCSKTCSNNDPEVLAKNKAAVSKALKAAYAERGNEINRKRAKTLTGNENGCCSPFGIKSVQEKIKQTNIERYGVDNVFSLKGFRGDARVQQRKRSIKIWKERGVDIEYIDDTYVKVLNACTIHGDVTLTVKSLHCRLRRCPKNSEGNPITEFLCRECHPLYMTNVERVVADILEKHHIEYVFRDRQMIKPYEIDFWIPSKNIAIECNGIYWHSVDCQEDDDYHAIKYNICRDKDITLLSVWEDDAIKHTKLIEALILSYVNGYKEEYWDEVTLDDIFGSSVNVIDKICKDDNALYSLKKDEYGVRLYCGNILQYICLNDAHQLVDYDIVTNANKYIVNLDTLNIKRKKGKIIPYTQVHQREGSPSECRHIGYILI